MKIQTYPPGYDTGEEQVTLSDLQMAGCNHPPWAGFHHMQKPTYMHEFEPGKCTCRISELRRGLEVMIK